MKSGIYWIVGPSGKAYIGSSKNVAARLRSHRSELQRGVHGNAHLQRAVNRHGFDRFLFQVIEYCEVDKLLEREQFHIDTQKFDTLYNLRLIAESNRGYTHTKETRRKVSAAVKALGAAFFAARAEANRGRKNSDETRAKMAEAARKRFADPTERAKVADAQRGRTITTEHRNKLAASVAATANPKSGYQGVYTEGDKWFASARIGGERRRIGRFISPELAYTWRLAYIAQMEWGF